LSFSYNVAEGDRRIFSILETLNGIPIRSLINQVDGEFTIELTRQQWAGLPNGPHTLAIQATNTVGTSTRILTFTKTNTPPNEPTVNVLNAMRLPGTGFVEFTPGSDADGDTQTMTLQFAADADFTSPLQFGTGLQRLDGTNWTAVAGVNTADIGARFRLPYSGVPLNQTLFVRVFANDGQASTNSAAVRVSMGDVLEFFTHPAVRDEMPVSALALLDAVIASAADVQVRICNNALDGSPTWENATAAYLARQPHNFTNTSKTAADWAVSLHVTINANNATGAIEVFRVGMGVL